jgi:DNA-binding NtrC family response regulator
VFRPFEPNSSAPCKNARSGGSAPNERAAILAHGPTITVRELPPDVAQKKKAAPMGDPLNIQSQERELIRRALERFKGNRKRAAEALKPAR